MLLPALVLASLSPQAGVAAPSEVEGWSIAKLDHACTMVAAFEGGTYVQIRHDHRLRESVLTVADRAFASVSEGSEHQLEVLFFSDGDEQPYPKGTFRGGVLPNGLKMVSAAFSSDEFLADVSRFSGMHVKRGSALVAAVSLEGSAKAVESLSRCAIEVSLTRSSDPLAG